MLGLGGGGGGGGGGGNSLFFKQLLLPAKHKHKSHYVQERIDQSDSFY